MNWQDYLPALDRALSIGWQADPLLARLRHFQSYDTRNPPTHTRTTPQNGVGSIARSRAMGLLGTKASVFKRPADQWDEERAKYEKQIADLRAEVEVLKGKLSRKPSEDKKVKGK